MKPLLAWLAIAVTSFGSLGGGYHLYLSEHPRRVLVVLDASYPMQADWRDVAAVLEPVAGQPYTEYSLYTEKSKVHGWRADVSHERITPFAPRDLSKLDELKRQREFAEADRIIFITNAGEGELPPLGGWELVRIGS